MSEDFKSLPNIESDVAVKTIGESLSLDALQRRRMLLRSLGKGSAVLAATVPMRTLASSSALLTPTGNGGAPAGLRCSVSGMQSGVHSGDTVSASTCNGLSPGWWGQSSVDVNGKTVPRRVWPYSSWSEKYDLKFGRDVLTLLNGKKPSLFQVMSDPTYANTQTRHWIGAWLNGLSGLNNFPYSGPEILAFYNLPSSDANRQNAYTLITTYLEML